MKVRTSTFLAIVLLSTGMLSLRAQAHSGRTNAEGCHNNRSNGTYHCHNGGTRPAAPVAPETEPNAWEVVSVGDGDTIRLRQGDESVTVRLACIDAPEMAQATYGELAKSQLQSLLPNGSAVTIRAINTDRYERLVAEVFQQDENINLALVESGHAVAYRQYLSNCNSSEYLDAELTAQQNRRVFWSQADPTMPWHFRQR